MATIVTRSGKGSPLTNTEVDANFTNLNTDKIETNAEVRAAVEAASDSNVFTDADHTKLNAIEASATADQTAAEILTAIKTVDGTGSGLDADTLDGVEANALMPLSGGTFTGGVAVTGYLSATTAMTVQNGSGTEGVQLLYNENGGEIALYGTSGNTKLLIDYLDSDNDGNGLGRILNLGAGNTGVQIGVANASNTGGITFSTGNNVTRQFISNIGDITNYNTDGSTAKMTWDASENNLTFVDGAKATFGNSADLQVYHDGSDSYVDDAGTGALILRGNSNVTIGKYTGETMGFFEVDGAVSLYHNNAIKLATTSTGINVTGKATLTSGELTFSGSISDPNGAAYIWRPADNTLAFGTANEERMRIDSSGNLLVGSTDTTLYNNTTGKGTKIGGDGRLDVARQADTVATFNRTGSSDGEIIRIVSSGTTIGAIGSISGDIALTSTANPIRFSINSSERMRIDSAGAVTMTGSLKPLTYQETYVAKSAASTVTCDLATGTSFSLTMAQNTTFAFTNPPSSGTAFSFTLFITQHSTAVTLTWPNTVDWAGGSAPDAAGANEVQAYGFITRDGGTTYYGFLGGTALA